MRPRSLAAGPTAQTRADTLTLDKVREVMKRPAMAGNCWQMEPAAKTKSTPAPLRPFDCFPTPRPEVQAGSAQLLFLLRPRMEPPLPLNFRPVPPSPFPPHWGGWPPPYAPF